MNRLFLVAALVPLTAAAPPLADAPTSSRSGMCPEAFPQRAADREAQARFQRLGDLPPAAAIKLVERRVDGCEIPLVVRYNIGSKSTQSRPPR